MVNGGSVNGVYTLSLNGLFGFINGVSGSVFCC